MERAPDDSLPAPPRRRARPRHRQLLLQLLRQRLGEPAADRADAAWVKERPPSEIVALLARRLEAKLARRAREAELPRRLLVRARYAARGAGRRLLWGVPPGVHFDRTVVVQHVAARLLLDPERVARLPKGLHHGAEQRPAEQLLALTQLALVEWVVREGDAALVDRNARPLRGDGQAAEHAAGIRQADRHTWLAVAVGDPGQGHDQQIEEAL